MRYRFDDCLLDTETGELFRYGLPVPLRRRAFRLLQELVQRAPSLVSRDELLDAVWGHDALSPNVLPQTISELRQALGDSAQTPRYIETRHRRGYRLLPEVTAEMVAVAPASVIAPRKPIAMQSSHRRWRWPYLLTAVLSLALFAGWLLRPMPLTVEPVMAATTLAIGRFPASDGVPDWLPGAGLELLTDAFADRRGVRVLRSDTLGLPQAAADARWQYLMHDLLGAPLALSGQWQRVGDEVSLRWSLIDLGNGRVLRSGQGSAPPERLDRLIDRTRDAVGDALDLPHAASAQTRPDAARREAYWQALALLARGEAGAAADALLNLAAADDGAPWLQAALVRALDEAGRDDQARARIDTLLADADALPLGQRLRLEAEQARLLHRPDQAAAALRALLALYPDDMEVRLALATQELDALQGDAARRSIAALGDDPRGRHDPRLVLLQARLARIDGDHVRARDLAALAAQSAERHALTPLAVEAALSEAASWRAEGDLASALAVLDRCEASFESRLSPGLRAELLLQQVSLLREQDRDAEAMTRLDSIDLPAFAPVMQARVRIEAALVHTMAGRIAPAESLLQQARPLARAGGEPALAVAWYNAEAITRLNKGDTDAARQAFDSGFSLARQNGLAGQSVALQVNAGLLLARERRFDEARQLWEQALAVFESLGDRRGQATSLGNLAAAAAAVGQAERALELNTQALALFRDLKLSGPRARTAYNLGLQAQRAGRSSDADALFEEAMQAWQADGQAELAMQAAVSLVEMRLLGGREAEAQSVLDMADALASQVSALRRSHLLSAHAERDLAAGRLESARSLFEQARQLREQAREPGWQALSTLRLLRVDLLAGAAPRRIQLRAEALASHFGQLHEPRDAARAQLLVAEASLAMGDASRANAALAAVAKALGDFEDAPTRMEMQWLAIWVAAPEERRERLLLLREQALALDYGRYVSWIDAALQGNRPPPGWRLSSHFAGF